MERFDACAASRVVRRAALAAVLAATGCGATPEPVSAESVAANEAALLAPFGVARTLVADRLVIEMTANFYDELVLPALADGAQDEERVTRQDGGTEVIYRNRSPRTQLRLAIGSTQMFVLEEARIVVLGGRQTFRLDATLEGGGTAPTVAVVEGDRRDDLRQARFTAGSFQRQR
jgi:hypothetical protein